ncbi:MAG TPA: NTP transferase domain-containing protein [Thermoanaerobaculia bacterium]|nr:NTP transferase domain-containing protein [Thermoanaerobaculia bacterium]
MTPFAAGGLIAAGEGSRLASLGRPKPLVEVAGVTLLARVLSNFEAAGVGRVAIIFNENEEDCAAFARARFPSLVRTIVLRTTPHSLASFRTILAVSPPGRLLVATVDTVCAPEDFAAFARAAASAPDDETVLAVTPLVADEKPLWVESDAAGRIRSIGGGSGNAVTAGIYAVSEEARAKTPPASLGRLREYLAWLCDAGEPMRAVSIGKAVDVDRPEDVRLAESLLGKAAVGAGGAA